MEITAGSKVRVGDVWGVVQVVEKRTTLIVRVDGLDEEWDAGIVEQVEEENGN